ncbi:MAG: thymidylate kinase [Patiriisocius sp.]|jgi:thymidylate kinase
MYIELIGVTGTGKSTFLNLLEKRLKQYDINIFTSYDYFLLKFGIKVSHPLIKTLFVDFFAFFWFFYSLILNFKFYKFVFRILMKYNSSLYFKINGFRNFVKKHMLHQYVNNSNIALRTLIVADEGIIQQTHSLFVHPNCLINFTEIDQYVLFFKLPENLFYFEAEKETLINRMQARGHQRINVSSSEDSKSLIENGKVVYKYLSELEAVKKVVINLTNDKEKNNAIEKIVNFYNK